jgi:ribosomal protein L11 methyltransferase
MTGITSDHQDNNIDLYKASIGLPAHLSSVAVAQVELVFSELLASVATSHVRSSDQGWQIEALFDFAPERQVVLELLGPVLDQIEVSADGLQILPLEQRDWLAENRASFPALRIGRMWVYGSHITSPPPAASLPLHVDAAQAFGSGTHPTTEGCLLAMQMIATASRKAPKRILDMGCGSAILAMAAARIWPAAHLMAADNDPVAVRVAAENVRRNRLAPHRVRCVVSNGFDGRDVRRDGPYDLVLANILAGPLRRMAPALVPHTSRHGWIVLSGILNEQANAVERAYAMAGARCWSMLRIGEWTTIVMRRSAVGTIPGLWQSQTLIRHDNAISMTGAGDE